MSEANQGKIQKPVAVSALFNRAAVLIRHYPLKANAIFNLAGSTFVLAAGTAESSPLIFASGTVIGLSNLVKLAFGQGGPKIAETDMPISAKALLKEAWNIAVHGLGVFAPANWKAPAGNIPPDTTNHLYRLARALVLPHRYPMDLSFVSGYLAGASNLAEGMNVLSTRAQTSPTFITMGMLGLAASYIGHARNRPDLSGRFYHLAILTLAPAAFSATTTGGASMIAASIPLYMMATYTLSKAITAYQSAFTAAKLEHA